MPNESSNTKPIDYYIARIDNTNFGNIIRETIHIVILSELSKEQLFEIAIVETEKYISKNKVNSLTIGFYDKSVLKNNEWYNSGFTHGHVDYLPNGSWTDTSRVKSGDYRTFQFVNKIKLFQFTAGMPPEIFFEKYNS
ncbi:hypothetical protein [[Clostridium] colinum]|uniref:hypothetical protein n=1 Tax=[Clostridium] colinum TaxID=36835 RepID=UPI00202444AA|nr:hypothetical protein [[Clostridium] colinum]